MVTVAGGMESDFSDSDSGMYFSHDIGTSSTKKNSPAFEEKKPIPNGILKYYRNMLVAYETKHLVANSAQTTHKKSGSPTL
ncbi:hypothetical protein TNCV_767161 [Trichonephila clavipes]|nr:hypothetical protein TNCV_767161 [Trichonephila clavipes]